MEFTDLFIAIARAAGIPAREVNGYAFTNDPDTHPVSLSQDILHAWPEYYDDQKGWIPIDPTWENTTNGIDYFNTFDLNHIAFVRKGLDSEYPYPAGSYKTVETQTKDVLVSVSDKEIAPQKNYETHLNIPESYMGGLRLVGDLTITNTGNTAIEESGTVETQYGNLTDKEEIPEPLPPFGSKKISLNFFDTDFFNSGEYKIKLSLAKNQIEKSIKLVPFYQYPMFMLGIGYLIGIPSLAYGAYVLLQKRNKS